MHCCMQLLGMLLFSFTSSNVSYASDCTLKAVLVKDKPAKSPKEDIPAEPQQYIEVQYTALN